MLLGIVFVLAACLIWSLIFVIPQFMQGFSAIEVVTGRYLFYGLASSLLFLKGKKKYPFAVWKKAFLYSFIFAVGYYPCVVLGLRYATPPICTLIMGIGPITIALYGNWKEKECSFQSLLLPCVCMFAGLLAVNAPAFFEAKTPSTYLWGIGASFCALATWTWYVVANARFLKKTPEVTSSNWATLNGVTILIMTGLFLLATFGNIEPAKYQVSHYIIGSAILGTICSWAGIFFWNKATLHLPVSLAGQLTIFEIIFGLILIYIVEAKFPPLLELTGIALFLIAVAYGVKKAHATA